MMPMKRLLRLVALLAFGAAAPTARAHDTWFAPLPPSERGELMFAFGTGERFPELQTPVGWHLVKRSGCRAEGGVREAGMRWVADQPGALVVRSARPVPATSAASCHIQLEPIELEIEKEATVQLYLDEIRAGPAIREHWATLRERGLRWRESYVKHARIEVNGEAREGVSAPVVQAQAVKGLGMDARIVSTPWPMREGDAFKAQVLRDGQPLAGLPVQLVSDLSPLGIWRTTDASGFIEVPLPLATKWLLRATDLRIAEGDRERFDSRFLTLAFEVLPRR
jgi:hypothetical protein